MAGTPYIRFYGNDWTAGTQSLSLEERGALVTIVALIASEGQAPEYNLDRLARRFGCTRAKTEKMILALCEAGKLRIENGTLIQPRAMKETEIAQKTSEKQSENARARWSKPDKKPKENNASSDAMAMPRECQPEPEPEPIDTNTNVFVERTSAQPPNPEQPKRKPSLRGSARGIRIPSNWAPTPIDYAAASNEGLTSEEINREADRFRDYWISATGRTATKLDWSATWRNWIRRAADDKRKRSGARPSQQRGGAEQTLSAFDRVAESLGGNGIRPAAPAQSDAFTIDGDYIVPGPRTGTC
jgi:uncharacterized protein YdaU (DUF1376 family)